MVVLVLCLFTVLAAGLVGIYKRLSPIQAFSDERRARQGLHQGRAETVATEGEALLRGLRALLKELAETVHLERGTANERQDRLDKARVTSEMLRGQLEAVSSTLTALLESVHLERGIADERQDRLDKVLVVSERLALQLDAASCALESLLVEVDAELSTVIDFLSREYMPERAKRIPESINNSRAKRAPPCVRGRHVQSASSVIQKKHGPKESLRSASYGEPRTRLAPRRIPRRTRRPPRASMQSRQSTREPPRFHDTGRARRATRARCGDGGRRRRRGRGRGRRGDTSSRKLP